MLSILGVILGPVLGLLDKIFGYVSNVETTKLTTQAQVEETSTKAMASVERQWWFVALMIPVFSIPYALYIWKAIVNDKLIAPLMGWKGPWATTDPITGTLGWVFTTVVIGLFLHSVTR